MTSSPTSHAILLGAGRPDRGQLPAPLFGLAGQGRVLDWQVDALAESGAEVIFVGGYRFEEVVGQYPTLRALLNPAWETTGATGSLLRGLPTTPQSCLVSYADILYRRPLVRSVCSHPGANVVVIDSTWRVRYDARTTQHSATAEVVEWRDGKLLRVYGRHDPRPGNGPLAEYVGLARLGASAVARLQQWQPREELLSWDIPRLLNALLALGEPVQVIDCLGEWAELDAAQDVARFVLGTKAETLDRLRPLVRHSSVGAACTFTVQRWREASDQCLVAVRDVLGTGRLVVRSSAQGEDGFDRSFAGKFDTELDVNGADAAVVHAAVERVLASYGDTRGGHQVLVQEMVADVALSGVVMTRTLSHGAPYRVVNYDDSSGRSDSVTSGRGDGLGTLYLHRDHMALPGAAPAGLLPVLVAVNEIEALVGHDCLDIEFIVSSSGCVHLLQVRPIAVNHAHWRVTDDMVRVALDTARGDFRALQAPGPAVLGERTVFSVMTDWNPAEIIGTRARRLAHSLYAWLITDEVWATQRAQYGYRALAPQPLMHSFAGHPYVDVRASLNSFVPAELGDVLAERLVAHYLQRLVAQPQWHDKVEFRIAMTCAGLDTELRAAELAQAGFSTGEIERVQRSLARLTDRAIDRLVGDLCTVERLDPRRHSITSSRVPPLRKALLFLDDCREHGTLPFAHLARAGFVATHWLETAQAVGVIDAAQRAEYLHSVPTVASACRDDAARLTAGTLDLNAFLARYGHLRPGTYDITVPSYADAPDRYLGGAGLASLSEMGRGAASPETASAASATAIRPSAAAFECGYCWPLATRKRFVDALASAGMTADFDRLDFFMRSAIAGREWAKFTFSRSVSLALQAIGVAGAALGLTHEQLSHLCLADLRAWDSGQLGADAGAVLAGRAAEGRLAHELALGIELPPLLVDEQDFSAFIQPQALGNFIGQARVTAQVACVAHELPSVGSLVGKIVLVLQADPGHDWLFGHGIAGLVTAYGGANSHMAVRAAEFGLPAAIGIGEHRWRRLAESRRLVLDCAQRLIGVVA